MKPVCLAVMLSCAGGVSHAACGAALETFLSCDIGRSGKTLNVCHDNDIITYSFGRPGAPELALAATIAAIDYTPWPGAGSTIWEEVAFENGDYRYITYGAVDRILPDDRDGEIEVSISGGVVVRRGDDVIAELPCLSGTVDFGAGAGLWDAKIAAGLSYDPQERVWKNSTE